MCEARLSEHTILGNHWAHGLLDNGSVAVPDQRWVVLVESRWRLLNAEFTYRHTFCSTTESCELDLSILNFIGVPRVPTTSIFNRALSILNALAQLFK